MEGDVGREMEEVEEVEMIVCEFGPRRLFSLVEWNRLLAVTMQWLSTVLQFWQGQSINGRQPTNK